MSRLGAAPPGRGRKHSRKGRRDRSAIQWRPLPGPQTAAFESEADELLYGGAAGGGKTDLLCGWGITRARRGIIYRREHTNLDGIVDRLTEIVGPATNKVKHRWDFGAGHVLDLGGVQHEDDWQKYQGKARDYIGFDELTQFMRSQYRMLITWLRTTVPGQRCRVIAASNPPVTEDGRWVIEEWAPWLDPGFPRPAQPGELRWYVYDGDRLIWLESPEPVTLENGDVVEPASRTFIPARLSDNPYLAQTDYSRRLNALPSELRAALRDGDFLASQQEDPWQVIPRAWVQAAMDRWTPERPTLDGAPLPLSAIGVDPARGGKDETVLARRYGYWYDALDCYPGSETPNGPVVAAQVLTARTDDARIILDVIGVGAAVYDALTANGVDVEAFNAGERSEASDKTGQLQFVNRRAEAWWKFRELLDPAGGMDVALPPDTQLRADLCAPRWKLTVRGIQIESKEDVKKRIGRSTDRADAVIQAALEPNSQLYIV